MKICRVIIPFTDKVTGEPYKENDEILLSDERIAEIRTVNTNLVYVIGEAPEPVEEVPEEPVEPTEPEAVEPAEEPVEPEEPAEKPKGRKKK